MRIPDWLVYSLVLAVIVFTLFVSENTRGEIAAPETTYGEAIIPAPSDAPSGPPLPETNPFDERILVQVGEVEDGIGTAFAINEAGLWLTARHVVDGCAEVGLAIGNGRMVPVEEVVRSPEFDLAILYTDRAPRTVGVDFNKQMRVGEAGYHVGFPQGNSGEVSSRLLARSRLVTRGRYSLEEGVLAWAETARSTNVRGTLAGMSGGPVFDADGSVVGVTVAESPRRGRIYTAAPSSVIRFLDEHSAVAVSGDTVPLSPETYASEANRLRSERAIVKVVCRVTPW